MIPTEMSRKENPNGTIKKYKARLVARGITQMKGESYDEVFSQVFRLNILRTILAIGTSKNYELLQYDVTTAYISGVLEEEILMKIPECLEKCKENKVLNLKKDLYGLKQRAR